MSELLLEDASGPIAVEDLSGSILLEGISVATLASQKIARAGVVPSYSAAAAGGDRITPGSRTFLHVKNGGGSPITVTVAATAKVDGDIAVSNLAVTVANGSEKMIGPLPAQVFTAVDGSGLADVTYSAVTTVTVAALELGA